MRNQSDNFISETFYTSDEMFAFQKVGRYYELYDRDSGYAFLKEFTSFRSMQEYIIKARKKEKDDAEADSK